MRRSKRSLRGAPPGSQRDIYKLEDVHTYRVDRDAFVVYIGGDPSHLAYGDYVQEEPGVEHRMADRFEQNLRILSILDPQRTITIMMASCGGNWEEGMQMFGAVVTCPNPVVVIATKDARSMTSLIPLAADRFVIRPPARYMVHRGQYYVSGLDQEVDTHDIERRRANKLMFLIYTARLREQGCCMRQSEESIERMLVDRMRGEIDVWFSADEAVRFGFADGVFMGNYEELLATTKHEKRRAVMLDVLRTKIAVGVTVKVSRPRTTTHVPSKRTKKP